MMRGVLARVGLRLRLTLVFAGAMALLLAALGIFLYGHFESSLDRSLNEGLRSRAEDVRALVSQADSGLSQAGQGSLATPGERFAQIIGPQGRVVDRTATLPDRPILTPVQQAQARTRTTLIAHATVPGTTGSSRLLAVPVAAQDQRLIVVVGTSLHQRDGALADVRSVLLIGSPIALVLASLFGYAVAAFSLRSVETMRRRARKVSLLEPGQRLPVPPAGDELSRLATTLNEMLARNEVAFERERTFMADASHELRTPLAILRAELEVALVGDSPRWELRGAIASAADEVDRLSLLAEDLLTLAQSDGRRLALEPERFEVLALLRRLSGRFSQLAGEAGATISTSAPPGLTATGDPRRLEQALGNLIDNAIRHGARTILVQAARADDRIELRVSDDGPGFPSEFLASAFDRFARSDRSRTSSGAGLGLSIVRVIARAHGGEAYVSNGPDGGAEVCIAIPARRLPPSERAEVQASGQRS
jgi:heavy metal sensor kinase